MGTVDELDLRYARSSKDNRRHGNEIVLFCDGSPFGQDGASGYVMKDANETDEDTKAKDFRERLEPVYPEDHDDSRDWTGPAQKLADQQPRKRSRGTLRDILQNRTGRDPITN